METPEQIHAALRVLETMRTRKEAQLQAMLHVRLNKLEKIVQEQGEIIRKHSERIAAFEEDV